MTNFEDLYKKIQHKTPKKIRIISKNSCRLQTIGTQDVLPPETNIIIYDLS